MKASLLRIWTQCLQLRQKANPNPADTPVQLDEKEQRRIQGLGYTDGAARP